MANSVDPDQTALSEQSDQGLHCLHMPFIRSFDVQHFRTFSLNTLECFMKLHTHTKLDEMMCLYNRAQENRKNSRSGPKLRILDQFQTPQNANKSVQQVCALNPIFPELTNFHESMMSKKSQRSSLPKLTTSVHLLNAILW